eukprot:4782247-Pyramimonas_sp.AAC.1
MFRAQRAPVHAGLERPGNPTWAPCKPRAGPVRQLPSSPPPRRPRGLDWIPVGPHSAGLPRG